MVTDELMMSGTDEIKLWQRRYFDFAEAWWSVQSYKKDDSKVCGTFPVY